jgi:flagellar M-ring protein FliF
LEQHITALEDVDSASVNLVLPERELFAEDQNPVTASVIIAPKPGSDIRENRKKVEGIERLIQFAVEGLVPDNITITDLSGRVLNDFEGLEAFDQIELTRRELRVKQEQEEKLKADIYRALAEVYTEERVEIVNIDVSIDMGKRTEETTEFFPITIVEDNPRTPFDETEVIPNVARSTRSFAEQFTGTGFNPEGPPGQEGQTPPAYKDLEGLVGEYTRTEDQTNYEVNERNIYEEKRPQIDTIAVSIVLDGVWRREYNENGNLVINPDGSISREYTPVREEELATARRVVEGAIGYNQARGDIVTVEHLQFDRTAQFREEDEEYRRRQQIQMIVLYVLIGLAVLLVSFIVFRLISREVERRRRLREEELSRQHQAMREAALRSAEEESTEVEMSVEERARLELQENAINMAREHPEDVAQLIRTWLMEE